MPPKKEKESTEKSYVVKLTWTHLWTVLVVFGGLFGTIFTAGIKSATEYAKIESYKAQQDCLLRIEDCNEKNIELKRQMKECEENNIFYVNQYNTNKDRLTQCLKEHGIMSNTLNEKYK